MIRARRLLLTAGAVGCALAVSLTPVSAQQEKTAAQKREERIQEYLRKKEERRLDREQKKRDQAAAKQAAEEQRDRDEAAKEAQRQQDEEARAAEKQLKKQQKLTAAAAAAAASTAAATATKGSGLPRGLARAQANVRASKLGSDPTVQKYLALVDQQAASPHQLAAFGNFLIAGGLLADAREYYAVALRLEKNDPVLWINAGTLDRQLGENKSAIDKYSKALMLNPNDAYAHYNLGATLDALGKYEESMTEYKIALTLDPTLADPAVNPQAVQNRQLQTVKLLLYQERAGRMGLPILEVTGGELVDDNSAGTQSQNGQPASQRKDN